MKIILNIPTTKDDSVVEYTIKDAKISSYLPRKATQILLITAGMSTELCEEINNVINAYFLDK